MYVRYYHIFLSHSSADGHLNCFHILATINSAVVNIGMHVSYRISVFVFFWTYVGVESLHCMIDLFLAFFEGRLCYFQ